MFSLWTVAQAHRHTGTQAQRHKDTKAQRNNRFLPVLSASLHCLPCEASSFLAKRGGHRDLTEDRKLNKKGNQRDTLHEVRNCLAFYTNCIIIVGCRKIKEKYHGYSDTNNILYVVHDSERSIIGSLIPNLCLCRGLGLPNTQQMVFHLQRNLQRGDILVHRTIQDIGHCVQSYPLHSFVDRRINWTIPSTVTQDRQASSFES